jgi:hypothetical protein
MEFIEGVILPDAYCLRVFIENDEFVAAIDNGRGDCASLFAQLSQPGEVPSLKEVSMMYRYHRELS